MALAPLGIICHGGAGVIDDKPVYVDGLAKAIDSGYRLLRQSARSIDAVIEAVRLMEDNPIFNAGTGSNLTLDGKVEMDAAVMTQDGRFGAVGCIRGVRNPVLVAHKVMTETDHVLMCGEGAAEFARSQGFEPFEQVTDRARQRLEKLKSEGKSPYFPKLEQRLKLGTVGAVAVDKHGELAVATSSGGITGRLSGRVGDTSIPGAGTYAAASGAVSCTGHGEAIVKLMLGRAVVDKMVTMPGSVAVTLALAEAKRKKAMCGVIGFDARGGVCFGHTTQDMAWGYMIAERLFMFAK